MNPIDKLKFVLAKEQTDCANIKKKYAKKIESADFCKSKGLGEAGKINWLNNNNTNAGFEPFTWTWEQCVSERETSFFPEGNKNPLNSGASSPNQDGGGGSMRPPRGRGAVMPAVLTPVVMDPSMGPPSNRARLDARRSEEKCKIEKKLNEILYSLAVEKENELYAGGCDPYQENVSKRKELLDKKIKDLKNKFLKDQSLIEGRKPCKT